VDIDAINTELDDGKGGVVKIVDRVTRIEGDTTTLQADMDYEYMQTNNLNVQVRSLQTSSKDISGRLTVVESD